MLDAFRNIGLKRSQKQPPLPADWVSQPKIRAEDTGPSLKIGGFAEEYALDDFIIPDFFDFREQVQSMPVKPGAIFVMIAHYRDDLCDETIADLFRKCKHCERVYVGVAEQILLGSDDVLCGSSLAPAQRQHVRIIKMNHTRANGPVENRFFASHLWRGEEHFLQIDAHMSFRQDWDALLCEHLTKIPERWVEDEIVERNRVIFTTYPVSKEDQLTHPSVPWICTAEKEVYFSVVSFVVFVIFFCIFVTCVLCFMFLFWIDSYIPDTHVIR